MSFRPILVKRSIFLSSRLVSQCAFNAGLKSPVFSAGSHALGLRSFHLSRKLGETLKDKNTGPDSLNTPLNDSSETGPKDLNWNDFLALRVKRRRVNLISSCFTAFLGVSAGWGFIANIEIDPTQLILGFDPAVVYSLALVICGGLGYLVGPSLGDVVFKSMIRKQASSFIKKDAEFLRHIRKNRPDPSNQNHTANPVTDYYGEKIGSLQDYRRWLRDGRVYRKKLEKFL